MRYGVAVSPIIKAKSQVPIKFHVRLTAGDGETRPSDEVVRQINAVLDDLDEDFRVI